jgi:hypothetical protein
LAVSCTPTTTPASTTTSEVAVSTTSTSIATATSPTDYVFFNDLGGIVSGASEVVYSSTFDASSFKNFALQSVISSELPQCGFEPCINTQLRFSFEFSVDGVRWNDLGTNTTIHYQSQLVKTTTGPLYARYVRVRAYLSATDPVGQPANYEYPGTVFVAARFTN